MKSGIFNSELQNALKMTNIHFPLITTTIWEIIVLLFLRILTLVRDKNYTITERLEYEQRKRQVGCLKNSQFFRSNQNAKTVMNKSWFKKSTHEISEKFSR